MAQLTYPTSDFVPFTKILSSEVNGKFSAITTFLNTTKINDDNIQNAGITRATKLKAGTSGAVVVNAVDGTMTDVALQPGGLISKANGSFAPSAVAAGGSGQILQSNGPELPSWVTPPNPPPPYRIVQCRVDANGQANFVYPAGGGADDVVIYSTPSDPLTMNINGTQYTATTQTVAGLSAPVSATAQVVSALAGDDQWTQKLGEYGSLDLVYDTGTTGFMPAAGQLCAFKVAGTTTEYFIGRFTLGSTSTTGTIKNCYRGYFRDSSNAAIPRAGITDNDVLTIQKLYWLFYDAALETFISTDIEPVYSQIEPTGANEGQLWYDTSTQFWKKYTSGAFVQGLYCIVGMCVIDENDVCVGGRAFEPYVAWSSTNTVSLVDFNNTRVRGSNNSEISVRGQTYRFHGSAPEWDISGSMRIGAETASTVYTLYVSDNLSTGNASFWVEATWPYYREDFQGWYHPHKPWRAVGYCYNNGSSNIASIKDFINENRQEKILGSTTVTTDTAFITYSNIIPGFLYDVSATCQFAVGTGALQVNIQNDGVSYAAINQEITSGTIQPGCHMNCSIWATADTITVNTAGADATEYVAGTGAKANGSWAVVREINATRPVVSQW